ncbi:MAG: 2-oxoacid:acceptor oxidoreductase family protein [Fidelibacterota bacterium]
MDIRISGFGGQGIIKAGFLVGKAASLFDGKHATLNQSFGPEARGGACSAQVIISDSPVFYPYIMATEILVAMSQEAYDRFAGDLHGKGILLYDADLVTPGNTPKGVKSFSIPSTRIAEEMGNRIFANVVMVGFFAAITQMVTPEAVRKALPGSVPSRFVDKNIEAFDRGFTYGKDLLKENSRASLAEQGVSPVL